MACKEIGTGGAGGKNHSEPAVVDDIRRQTADRVRKYQADYQ